MSQNASHFSNKPGGLTAPPNGLEIPALPRELSGAGSVRSPVNRNRAEAAPSRHQCLHQLFEAQAKRTPDAPALAFAGTTLSYRELNSRANQLARHLRSLGVRPDVLVGLCVDRSLEMMVGLLAILKAGGAYLPLDPAYPADRLGFMLEDAQTSVVLVQRKLASALPDLKANILFLDDSPSVWDNLSSANLENQATPNNLAYVIFTSGSTGRPKGVLITHYNVVRLMHATEPWFHFNERDVWTMFHSFAFDFSVWEIWGALLYGGKLVVVPYFVSRSPSDFYELLAAEKVTVLNQTPTAFRQLIQAETEAIPARQLALRLVIFGGEALVMSSLQPWFARHGDEHPQLVNMYGITETTVHVTYRPLKQADVSGPSVIGEPIPDLQVHILDEHCQPVPTGTPGELFVSGAGLARGYLHRPELTAERFLFRQLDGDSETRLYRTGDLARQLPGGDIEYLGRIDSQIKIRGHRIELGEIETVLRRHPEIADCVTLAHDGGPGDQQLVAYLVCQGAVPPAAEALREWLGEELPAYMIPARYVVIPEVPLTPNGKADRKALMAAGLVGGELLPATDFVAPRNDLESSLAEIWQVVLQRERIGIRDNFFALGGHSLLAILICSRINSWLGMTVPLRWVFEHPTVEALASQAASLVDQANDTATVGKADRQQPVPMSFGQQQLWLVQQALPDPSAYNEYVTCRLAGPVDRQKVQQALLRIMERHEVLRTALVQEGYDLVQQINSAGTVALPWQEMDLTEASSAVLEESLAGHLQAWAREPFNLARAPLWRALWITLGPVEQILALAFHHSIVDEWSLRLLFQELERLYAAPADTAADLPVLPLQYADFAVWQRQQLTGAFLERQRHFWRERLRDLPPALELPADQARPRQPSGHGKSHHFQIPGPVVAGLRELARQEGTTLFTMALAAFQVWLYRLTGQSDIIVGTPIANRECPEIQPLLGYFLNTLPLRTRVDAAADFKTLLHQVRAHVLAAFDHAQLPFEQMVELAIRERTVGRHPLYQVMFVLLEEGVPPLRLGSTEGRVVLAETGTSKNDLVLNIQVRNAIWECRIDYATDLFTDQRAASMAGNLQDVLQSIAECPTTPIRQLNLPPGRHRLPVPPARNANPPPGPRGKCVHHWFEEQVERTPDAAAVVFEHQSLTYRELDAKASQLARHLRSLGVGSNDAVGLCVERSLEMLVSLLGILKAGGAYVPFDPALPSERLASMIDNAACSVMITRPSLQPVLNLPVRAPKTLLVLLDALPDAAPLPSGEGAIPCPAPADLAYIMYTSGSTGQPKGVEMPHQALVNLLDWQCSLSAMGPGSRTLQFASLGFDVSFQEIFSTFATGGTLVLVNEDMRKDPVALLATVKEERIERLFLPFVMLDQLAEAAGDQDSLPDHLQEISVAGEQLRISPAIRRFFARLPGCRLWNHYGPVEAHVVTSHELSGPPHTWPDLPPIGRPIPHCQIHLLDSQLKAVAPGAIGDLFIGGNCLARGYRNRPDLTAERFLPHPAEPGARLYRTGDLARWQSDGSIEFLGRADHQVKIRGFRVELGEIEAVLAGHAAVSACVVVAHDLGRGEKQLVAHVVGRESASPTADSLRPWLLEKLPDYMIPARFLLIPELPVTPNGKADRKALMELDSVGEELAPVADFVVPRNDVERTLAEIWQVVLRRDQVGIRDNFFNLGGHSLLAAVMCSHVSRRLGLAMPMRWVFEHPTIEALARQAVSPNGKASAPPAMEKASRHESLPMSFGQQQMWLLRQTASDPAAFNESVACHLGGPVDRHRVKQALQQIMERHEVLRTALLQHGRDLVQEISAAGTVALPWQEMNFATTPSGEREGALAEYLTIWARAPFNLARAPLWRAVWVDLGSTEHVLAVAFHHSIADEWSLRLFFQELEALYATPANMAADLPVLPVQYADFAVWQRRQLTGAFWEQQRQFWCEQLRDLPPPLELPADRVRPRQPSGRGEIYHFQIPGPVVAGLRELARQEGTTLFTVALAAFQVWLYRLTGQADIIACTPVANRAQPEVQHLLGYFLNILPIRAHVDAQANFQTVLRLVRSTVLNSFDHAALPIEQIAGTVIQERAKDPQSLHQVMFVFLEEGLPPLHFDKVPGRLTTVSTRTSKCDLLLDIFAGDGHWNCRIEYATDLFSRECATRLAGHLTELLQSIVEHPRQPVSQLNLLTIAERQRILCEWNQTESAYPRDTGIDQLFADQAKRTPEAVAVVFGDRTLTYQELDARASHLAQQLRTLGVGPNVIVGLRVERSPEMIVALLGILQAGGAYWAVEDNLPPDRLRLLLVAARPRVLLVRRNSKNDLANLAEKTPDSPEPATIAFLEDLLESPAPQNTPATPGSQPGQPAYVSYTSGSTGRPKGVVIPHRGVVRLVKGADYVSLSEKDVLLHLSPLSFDASTFELWGALLNGGRVVLMPPGPPALSEIAAAIRRHGVTTAWLTAGLFHLMVEEHLADLKPLRQLLAGGDVLSPEHVRKARRALPDCRIINGYGPTENTTFTCCHTIVDEDDLSPSVPIGRPIANTRVYVLDSFQRPVPVGVSGELYAGGDGVACGYLHQPELTAERFLPDPYSEQPGARLYRTGDLVRWRPDGTLEFLGRIDAQVKIRGFRVELGEIETCLLGQPDIREAVVVAREGLSGGKRLVAYLVAKTATQPDTLAVQAALAEKLPDYMVPHSIVWLEKIPLTGNGKVDRQALPAPLATETKETADHPADVLEWELLRIWRKLFQRENIGLHDNFFALGGHSLLATRLAADIEKILDVKMPVTAVFQSPTVESLARRFTDEHWSVKWSSLVPLNPQGTRPPLYFVHGINGDVFRYVELAQLLGADQPSYGIQAIGLDGKTPRHASIKEMAAHYVSEITSFQTTGPIYLAGYSLGASVAFEVACQLHLRGRRVALLALLDGVPCGPAPWRFRALAEVVDVPFRVRFHWRRWSKLTGPGKIGYFGKQVGGMLGIGAGKHPEPAANTLAPEVGNPPPEPSGQIDYFEERSRSHSLLPYPGCADIFVSEDGVYALRWTIYGWRWYWQYLVQGGISCHHVPGRHLDIFSPANLPVLTRSFARVLHRRQKENEPPSLPR